MKLLTELVRANLINTQLLVGTDRRGPLDPRYKSAPVEKRQHPDDLERNWSRTGGT